MNHSWQGAGRKKPVDWRRAGLIGAVTASLAVVLALGSLAGATNEKLHAVGQSASLLPRVDLTARTATVWNCPGPLDLSGGSASVAVANPSNHRATVIVRVSETAAVAGSVIGHRLKVQLSREVVPAGSELEVPLKPEPVPASLQVTPTAGGGAKAKPSKKNKKKAAGKRRPIRIEGAVSLTVSGASVAVTETARQKRAVETSPCALGTSTEGYTASGTTFDSSTVRLAVFDPSAAPAVVNLAVGTPRGLEQPQALQGVVVPPESLAVIDLAKYVPQQSRIAVAATASVGHVVIGSFTHVAASFRQHRLGHEHSYTETGSELAVGVGKPLRSFVVGLGPTGAKDAESVRLFNPGKKPARVLVRTYQAGKSSSLSVVVPPGETTSAPVTSVAGPSGATESKASSKTSSAKSSGQQGPALASGTGGVITVTTENGQGVVAEHETVVATSPGHLLLLSDAPAAGPARRWLLAGAVSSPALDSEITITDASKSAETAVLEELHGLAPISGGGQAAGTVSGRLAPTSLGTFSLQPGVALGVDVGKVARASALSLFGILVRADGPVVVSGALVPSAAGMLPAFGAAVAAR